MKTMEMQAQSGQPTQFYSYLWLREDGSPYYAGKGSGRRAYRSVGHTVHCPPNRNRILVFPMLSEVEAFESEVALIELFGRKDLGTGCLRNLSSGGEGPLLSEAHRRKLSEAHKGLPSPRKGKKLTEEEKKNLKGFPKDHTPWNKGVTGYSWSKARRRVFEQNGTSESTRQKMRAGKIGKPNLKARGLKRTEETKQKMRKPRTRSWTLSEESKKKQSVAAVLREAKKKAAGLPQGQRVGFHHTEATKRKLSELKKGKLGHKLTPEHIEALTEGRRRAFQQRKRESQ